MPLFLPLRPVTIAQTRLALPTIRGLPQEGELTNSHCDEFGILVQQDRKAPARIALDVCARQDVDDANPR